MQHVNVYFCQNLMYYLITGPVLNLINSYNIEEDVFQYYVFVQ